MKKLTSKHKLLIIILLIFVLVGVVALIEKNRHKKVNITQSAQPVQSALNIEKEVYQIDKDSYGYKILVNGGVYINQPYKPAVAGNQKMTKEEAEKLANLVIEKLKKNLNESPSLSVEEVMGLH